MSQFNTHFALIYNYINYIRKIYFPNFSLKSIADQYFKEKNNFLNKKKVQIYLNLFLVWINKKSTAKIKL